MLNHMEGTSPTVWEGGKVGIEERMLAVTAASRLHKTITKNKNEKEEPL